MKTLFTTLLIIIPLLFSCKKGKADFTISGTVTNTTFNQPLEGATVQLYETVAGTGDSELIQTTTTDQDGSYTFTFPRDRVETYALDIQKENYFEIRQDVPFSDLSIEETNTYNFTTTAKAWVNLRFINDNPQPTDAIEYTRQHGKLGCEECCSAGTNTLYGAVDTSIICINDGNTDYGYYYIVQGSSNQGSKLVNTTPFDTVELVLNY